MFHCNYCSVLIPFAHLQDIDTKLLVAVLLLYVLQVFHFKVVLANREHHMFPDDVVTRIFSNIKSIYQFHHDFLLPQLERKMAEQ